MRRLRRVTALLVSVLLVQLTLAATGTLCGVHGGVAGRSDGRPGAAHTAMAMGSVAANDGVDASAGACSDCETAAEHVPCNLPWAPGACAQMTSCAAPMVVEMRATPEASRATTPVLAAVASMLPGPTSPPEPPPPRA